MRQQRVSANAATKRAPRMPLPSPEPIEAAEVPDTNAVHPSPAEVSMFVDILKSTVALESAPAFVEELHRRDSQGEISEPESPRRVTAADLSTRDAAAIHEVARVLGAAEAWLAVVDESTGLMPVAARDALKAEMARATALLQLLRFLKGELFPVQVPVSCDAVVQRVVQSVDPERRLRGITLTATAPERDARVAADEGLLAHALVALLLGTFTLLEGVATARVEVSVSASLAGTTITVVQRQAPPTPVWTMRPFGVAWTDADGGIFSAVAMTGCEQLARACGGRFLVKTATRSTSASFELPPMAASSTGATVRES